MQTSELIDGLLLVDEFGIVGCHFCIIQVE